MRRRGFVLIFSLWVLGFLTVLALGLAGLIRQKMLVLSSLDEHARIKHVERAAIVFVKNFVRNNLSLTADAYTPLLKQTLHNNEEFFGEIRLNRDVARVGYTVLEQGVPRLRYGVVDEQQKININHTDVLILRRLIERVLGVSGDDARRLAEAILDWRQTGTSEVQGFFSDEYYSNLQYSYPKKNEDYELLEELLLVKGINRSIFDRLSPFLTVYGDGKININTAPAEVLAALGLDDAVVEKILFVRRGKDAMEATSDDYTFYRTYDVAGEMALQIKLTADEVRAINALNAQKFLTTTSSIFSVDIEASIARRPTVSKAYAIIEGRLGIVLSWREK